MNEKYYLVKTMCGHVGRNCYIPIVFSVKAENGREAARIAREIPRVKHNNKYAILSVKEVTYEEYLTQYKINENDQYLNWRERRFDEDYDREAIFQRAVRMDGLPTFGKRKAKDHSKRKEPRREAMQCRREIMEDLYSWEC